MHEKMCFQHQGFRDKWLCQQHEQQQHQLAINHNKIGPLGPILNIRYLLVGDMRSNGSPRFTIYLSFINQSETAS